MGKYDNNSNMLKDIKGMSYQQLNELSNEIRKEIIDDVSTVGGHLASNLGVVELTIALHKVFDCPTDKIVWDVGHQTYIHKFLTGRREELKKLKQIDGISGFPKISESIYDTYNSGHSGTSISACFGYAKARDLNNDRYNCIAVIGDGALTGGVAWEALNSVGASKTPMLVVLNDNEMSISGNVGGIAKHLRRLRTSKAYNAFKNSIKRKNNTFIEKHLSNLRDKLKYAFLPGVIFEELGFKYFGPIDGHDIKEMCEILEAAASLKRPAIVHVITKKGKGFAPAEKNPAKFHGIGSYDPNTVDAETRFNDKSWSEIFGNELIKLASNDSKIVAVSAAMIEGTGLHKFQLLYPNRTFDVAIAEQNAVSFAAGLALNGMKPVVALYSTFMQRAYDQILSEVCLMNLPVIFGVDRAGITGRDGETHQGQFDIAFLRSMPNMTLLSPRDEGNLRSMLDYAFTLNSPVAIRYSRGTVPEGSEFYSSETVFDGKPQLLIKGSDILFIADGNSIPEAIKAQQLLKDKEISAGVCDIRVIKPLPIEELSEFAEDYKAIVTIEDGTIKGGFGEEISAYFAPKCNMPVLNIAWPDKFIQQGRVAELRKMFEIDGESIALRTEKYFEEKIRRTLN